MAITVLGELRLDGEALSPRERVVLATLVVRAGRAVSPHELADAYWGESPPATWPKQVQAAVGRLRRRLGPSSIITGPGGYTLAADPESVDAGRFERLATAGRLHLMAGEPGRAVAALEDALGLWRGEPYADLPEWPAAQAESARLGELLAMAREDLVQARMDRGDRDSVVAETERLVAEYPLRERRWVLLATALYRAGRQADALAAVRLARRRLDEELGVEPGPELSELEVAILRHDPTLDVTPVTEAAAAECPYRGLTAFDAVDEQNFFGRDEEVVAALDRLNRGRFLALAGPSGCGKSSLVRAGIAPSLRRRGLSVRVVTPTAGAGAQLRSAIATASDDVLIVDQFEELFQFRLPEEQVAELCGELARYPGAVVLTVRSDFLDECAAQPALAPLLAEGVRLVTPMTEGQLRVVIVEPARRSGLRLEHGLVELVLRDAAGAPGVLPHVSHALVETWQRREGSVLTIDGYESSGGISGAIAQSADRLYRSLTPDQRDLCRSTLLRLVALAPDGSPIRQRLRLGPLRADQARDQVLSRLAAARLISTEGDSVVVAHEAVALAWPRLRNWLQESADGVRRMAALAGAAERWEADGQPAEDLYRGARLEAALELQASSAFDLTPVESRFLAESRRREEARLADLRERTRREARQNRRLRGLLVAAVVLLMVSGVAAGLLVSANREADQQRESASVEALVARSLALRESERDVAALLAAEAYRRWPDDPRARSALMGTLTAAGGFLGNSYLQGPAARSGAGIPGSDAYLVAGDTDVAVVGTDGVTHASADVEWSTAGGDVGSGLVAVSADGRTGVLARGFRPSGGSSARVELVAVELPSLVRRGTPVRFAMEPGSLAVSPDGSWAALGHATDGQVAVVDLDDGSVRRRTFDLDGLRSDWAAATLLTATERGRLVVGGAFAALRVLHPDDLRVVRRIRVPAGSADVAVATDGGLVVTSGSDRLLVAPLATGTIRWSLPFQIAHPAPCPYLAISAAARSVFCGDWFGNLQRHDLRTGLSVESLDPQLGSVGPLLVSDDGAELAALGAGVPAVSRWRLDGSGPVTTLVARGSVVYEGWDDTDTSFLVARRPGRADEYDDLDRFALWDPERDAAAFTVPGRAEGVGWAGAGILVGWSNRAGGVAFLDTARGGWYRNHPELDRYGRFWPGASGAITYGSSPDGDVVLIDPATGRPTGNAVKVGGFVASVSENPDASRIATASWDNGWTVRVHDVASGKVVADGLVGPQLVAYAPNGDLYAAQDGRITRHDPSDLRRLGTLPGAHGEVNSLQFTRDGSLLLATANDETATLYDVSTGLRLGDPIRTAAPLIVPAWLHPDGKTLAMTVKEGVALWDLDPTRQFAAACRLAGRELTPEEWTTYLGDDAHQIATCADVLWRN